MDERPTPLTDSKSALPLPPGDAWQIASSNFDEDNGSLPTIEIGPLAPESVRAVYR